MMNAETSSSEVSVTARPVRPLEWACFLLLVFASVFLPLVFGELYPFTIAPMFRDNPRHYCEYQIFGPEGRELPLSDFQLQRNYDGNPVGMGAGLKPPATFNQFGQVAGEKSLRLHLRTMLNRKHPNLEYVDVVQTVIGPVDSLTVGVIRTTTIREYRDVP